MISKKEKKKSKGMSLGRRQVLETRQQFSNVRKGGGGTDEKVDAEAREPKYSYDKSSEFQVIASASF